MTTDEWKFYAWRPVGNIWLDNDVQLKDCSLTYGLSTINSGGIVLPVPDQTPMGSDGRPVWGRWDTVLLAEKDGELDWAGIADTVIPGQVGTQVSLVGLSAWLSRVDYDDVFRSWEIDVFDVLRELLDHAATKPRGFTFARPSTSSSHTVGDPDPPPKPTKPGRHRHETKTAYHASTRYTTWQSDLSDWKDAYSDNQKYKLQWWDSPIVGNEFNTLAAETGFDWREEYRWVSPFNPEFKINFADDLSTVRTDFSIIDGQNADGRLVVSDHDEGYANTVIELGAGHGRNMLRKIATYDDGRLYSAVYARKKREKNRRQLQRAANRKVAHTRRIDPQIGTVNVFTQGGMAPATDLLPGDIIPIISDYTVPRVNVLAQIQSKTVMPLNPGVVQLELVTQQS